MEKSPRILCLLRCFSRSVQIEIQHTRVIHFRCRRVGEMSNFNIIIVHSYVHRNLVQLIDVVSLSKTQKLIDRLK